MLNLNCFNIKSNFILISWKGFEKMKPTPFTLYWFCDPHLRQWSHLGIKGCKLVVLILMAGLKEYGWKVCVRYLSFSCHPTRRPESHCPAGWMIMVTKVYLYSMNQNSQHDHMTVYYKPLTAYLPSLNLLTLNPGAKSPFLCSETEMGNPSCFTSCSVGHLLMIMTSSSTRTATAQLQDAVPRQDR